MSSPVHRVDVSASMNEAAQSMWEHDIGVVPVVDAEGRIEGIVTDRDVAMTAYLQGRALRDIPVREVMSSNVQSVRSDEAVVAAAYKMSQHQMRRLPVLDGEGALVGMLSLNDLAGASSDSKDSGVTEHDLADTLRAVCMPRAGTEPLAAS
ncbi:MAG: CBS domain-containing protein [Gemmatimonadota bacterium]|nr:CBS domain-containing protein [Gemmatimonadota bacterium]